MVYHEFKISAIHGSASNVIKGSVYNSEYNKVFTIFDDGAILDRAPYPSEEVFVYNVSLKGRETKANNEQIHVGLFRFVPEEFEAEFFKNKPLEKKNNILMRAWYKFILTHDHIRIKGPDGNDTNLNNRHCAYELNDITKNTLVESARNKERVKAGELLTNLYKGEKKAFRDFCYAYQIPLVEKFDDDTLFNLCMKKIHDNPEWFMAVYKNKNRDILALIYMALERNIGVNGEMKKALTKSETAYYMDGIPIAQTIDELQEVLLLDTQKRKVLESLMEISITSHKNLDSIELPIGEVTQGDLLKDAVGTAKAESALEKKFAQKVTPVIIRTKDIQMRQQKLDAIIGLPEFESIAIWGKEFCKNMIDERNSKDPKPYMVQEMDITQEINN